MIKRILPLPNPPSETFFLWGARQTGKSSLLKVLYPTARYIDLLKSDEYRKYTVHPEALREELCAEKGHPLVVIDEIQKIPPLLDEVHWLMENARYMFGLCGSSARKVKRGHANLLGGRALRFELHGLSAQELGTDFNLLRMLNHGYLPRHYLHSNPRMLLHSYISDYLKEEIAAEGLVRNLPAFSRFMDMAVLSDTEPVNFANISRECGVSGNTVKDYFQILEDTLLARWLPSYTKRAKRKVVQAPKFYFGNVGIVNQLARRGELVPGSELFGKAFENWIFHELSTWNDYSGQYHFLSYWRLTSGIEVDFILSDMHCAIEAKSASRITIDHLKGLRHLKKEHPEIRNAVVVCLEDRPRKTEDGILILPYRIFIENLWAGELTG